MRKEGLDCIMQMEDFQVMGFSDVLWSLPHLVKKFYAIRDAILDENPDGVIMIDYPGFNLRLAKHLRHKGYKGKLIQYICPTVWAHGKKRIDGMVDTLDLLLTILPFEPACFAHTPLKVKYVGHPLINIIENYKYKPFDIPSQTIAIFPGSRLGEIRRNLTIQLEAVKTLKNASFGISYAQQDHLELIKNIASKTQLENVFFVPSEYTYELMQNCQTALSKSGTVTLELALHNRVSLVTYKLSYLNYLIAKHVLKVRLPHYCLVNLLSGKEVFPELIDHHISPDRIGNHLKLLHHHSKMRQMIADDCSQLRNILGSQNANIEAAKAIEELFL